MTFGIEDIQPEEVALAHVTVEDDSLSPSYNIDEEAKNMANQLLDNMEGFLYGERSDFPLMQFGLNDPVHRKAATKLARHFRKLDHGKPMPMGVESGAEHHDGEEVTVERHKGLVWREGFNGIYVETVLYNDRIRFINYGAVALHGPSLPPTDPSTDVAEV